MKYGDNMQLRKEISDGDQPEDSLEYRLAIEKIIASVSTIFIDIESEDVDTGINQVLQKYGKFFRVDRSYLIQFSGDGKRADITHEWRFPEIEPEKELHRHFVNNSIPWIVEKLNRHEIVHISRVSDLPEAAGNEKKLLQQQNIKSIVTVPMIYNGSLTGLIGFESLKKEKKWLKEDLILLRTTAEIIVAANAHKKTHEALHWELDINKIIADLSKELISLSSGIKEMANLVLESAKKITGSDQGYISAVNLKKRKNAVYILTEMQEQCTMPVKDERKAFSIGSDGQYSGLLLHPLNTLVNTLESFYTNSFQQNQTSHELPEGHIPLEKLLSVPVILENEVVGQIVLINSFRKYTSKDIDAIEQLARLYALALRRYISEEEKTMVDTHVRRSRKMEAIGTLAGGIAHDFNNILSPIIGYAEITMESTSANSNVKKNMGQIIIAANRARELVTQILTISAQREQEKKPVRINLIVKEVLKLLRASLPAFIEIREAVLKETGNVLADPAQIHQLIMNLCINAGHAMQEKGGILKVSLAAVVFSPDDININSEIKPGSYLKLSVSDTGHGMEQEVMEKIFDPYFTTSTNGRGNGMGLATVHGIVKSCDGQITVLSEPGKGSTFHVYLPRIEVSTITQETESIEPIPKGTEHILIVDDEKLIADMLKEMLELLGYHVTAFTDPDEALQMFYRQSEDINLVITDMTMPKMTGMELSHKIISIKPDIPIILCSGFSETLTEQKVKEADIRKYVAKPIDIRKMAKNIRDALYGGG